MSTTDFADYETLCAGFEQRGYSSSCTPDGVTKTGYKKYSVSVRNSDGIEVFKSIAIDKTDKRGVLRRSVLMENQLKEVSAKAVASAMKQFDSLI